MNDEITKAEKALIDLLTPEARRTKVEMTAHFNPKTKLLLEYLCGTSGIQTASYIEMIVCKFLMDTYPDLYSRD